MEQYDPNILKIIKSYVFKLMYVSKPPEKIKILQNYLCQYSFSGTIYRKSVARSVASFSKGDIIDYTTRITSWTKTYDKVLKFVPDGMMDEKDCNPNTCPIYKLECLNLPAKDISDINVEEDEVLVTAGIKLKVEEISDRIITVKLI